MDSLEEYELETAVKLRTYSFTADLLSRYSKQEDVLEEAEGDGDFILTAKVGDGDLEPFLIGIERKLNGVLPQETNRRLRKRKEA